MSRERCLIGSVVAAHGIRGVVKVQSFSDVPGRFSALESVLLGRTPAKAAAVRVLSASDDGPKVLMQFEDCDDRDAAERLVGMNLYIEDADMASPPEGRHFIHDLIGCAVFTASGDARGTVRDVMLMPANDVYVVDYKGHEVLVPAVPAFILAVDTAGKRITIEEIPGLFDHLEEDDEGDPGRRS
ncbi:MAG: 16S rRNA processing protein RimM [Bacteroidetes bacterium]|nr:16S rRNA processing protein RimM [Bacteroidota bacterium]